MANENGGGKTSVKAQMAGKAPLRLGIEGKGDLKLWRVGKGEMKGEVSLSKSGKSAYVPSIDLHILIGSEVKLEKQIQNWMRWSDPKDRIMRSERTSPSCDFGHRDYDSWPRIFCIRGRIVAFWLARVVVSLSEWYWYSIKGAGIVPWGCNSLLRKDLHRSWTWENCFRILPGSVYCGRLVDCK